jgi:cell division protein FtsW
MTTFARTDTSVVGSWWWTVDRWSLLAVLLLLATGALLSLAASPSVAQNIGLQAFHFSQRHFGFLAPAILVMLLMSMMSPRGVRRVAGVGLLVSLALMAVTLVVGIEVKGATRWLHLGAFSLQPSEFVKPCFIVISAWLLAVRGNGVGFPATSICCGLFVVVLTLLIAQPDFGMAVVVCLIWGFQFFMAGLSLAWVGALAMLAVAGGIAAYMLVPHVTSRFDRFMDPASGDSFQIDLAMKAFTKGGLFGRGPGEGTVKQILPDAHTDFVFAVAGEEFGLLVCLAIVALFGFVTLRGFYRLLKEEDMFVLLAAAGLLALFGMQAVINIGVNLNLLPTKGMTLPFVSYGGSSLLAMAMGVGMLLSLTRRRRRRAGGEI